MRSSIERTPQFVAAAANAGFPDEQLDLVYALLELGPFDGQQLSEAIPEDPDDDAIGIYELGWPESQPKHYLYYSYIGVTPIWLLHLQTGLSIMDMLHGAEWLTKATAECRRLALQIKRSK